MSAGFPRGAPLSTHVATVSISSSLSDGSSLNLWIPTFFSMNQGGISRAAVFRLMAAAQGRTSSYVVSGIGATPFVRWQFSHDRWRMGAISLVNVTPRDGVCPPDAGLGARAPR